MPHVLLAAALFFLPFMDFRPETILFTLSDLLFLLAALAFVYSGGVNLTPFGALTPHWYGSVLLLLGALLISSVTNNAGDRWLSVAAQYAASLVVLPLILLRSDRREWVWWVKAFVLGILTMEVLTFVILNYYDWSYADIEKRFGPEFLTGMGRVSAFLGGANMHAAMLCMCMPFVYYLRVTRRISRPVFALAVGIICVGVFYTASVTGFATLLIVTTLFFVSSRVSLSPQLMAGLAAILIAYLSVGAPAPAAFEKRVGSALESGEIDDAGTFTGRLELMKEAWAMADRMMVVGVGADRYREISEFGAPVHNTYLLLWVEGGFLALVGWVGLLSILGLGGLSMLRWRSLDAAVALSVFSVLLIFSMTSAHMYARVWIAPVLLAMAPVFGASRGTSRPGAPSGSN